MTEDDWLTTRTKPRGMFHFIGRRCSRRKQVLLSCALSRRLWPMLIDDRLRNAIVMLERFVEGLCTEQEYHRARQDVDNVPNIFDNDGIVIIDGREAKQYVRIVTGQNTSYSLDTSSAWCVHVVYGDVKERQIAVCDLFREVIGNPFRPWTISADFAGGGLVQPDGVVIHRSETARQLAEGIQFDQAFDRLPILADAVEESGVTDRELLDHLRRPDGHVRGCWALDLILGKS